MVAPVQMLSTNVTRASQVADSRFPVAPSIFSKSKLAAPRLGAMQVRRLRGCVTVGSW